MALGVQHPDREYHCPNCNGTMQVMLPIWVTPGDHYIDISEIDWDSSMAQSGLNWWCAACESHHLPKEADD